MERKILGSGLGLFLAALLLVLGPGCQGNIPPTTVMAVTPCPTPVLFNSCQSLTANGTWNPPGTTYTSTLSFSPYYVTYGTHSLDAAITAAMGWNQGWLQLDNFTPVNWMDFPEMVIDMTVDPSVVAGATYSDFVLVGAYQGAPYNGPYFSFMSANTPTVSAGSQSVTVDINVMTTGSELTSPSQAVSFNQLYFVYSRSTPSAPGQGLGNIYVDNIRLLQNCP